MPSNKQGDAVLHDYFRYNDWANSKLLALCEGLSESQWDEPHAMGFGSLRATLFHVLYADELWQDRLENQPWAPLLTDERQIALSELHARYAAVAERRRRILHDEDSTGYERLVEYLNTERQPFRHRLCELLLHLANHSIHHRAQALNMLRRQQRTVPGGLDYLFYKLAHPSLPQPSEMAALVRSWKFDVGEVAEESPRFHAERLRQYCDYGTWATDLLLTAAADVGPAAWTRDFEIGPGSLQKTLSHVLDSERWWLGNLTQPAGDFETTQETISPSELRSRWRQHVSERTAWLADQSDASLGDAVTGTVSGGLLQFRRGEVLLQLCGHGTHHRAQVVNMFRRLAVPIPALDFVAWLRLGSPLPHPL